MEAAIGLIGVALGALLAPGLDWARQSKRAREERRKELLEATAEFIAASGDALLAEWGTGRDQDAWRSGVGFRANAAHWRLALLAPDAVARAAHVFAEATDTLGKRIQAAGGWDGTQIAAEYDAWKQAEQELINAARAQLGDS
jgi:hypothetical protein